MAAAVLRIGKRSICCIAIVIGASALSARAAAQHAGDMLVASSQDGGGILMLNFNSTARVQTTLIASERGINTYRSTDLGFDAQLAPDLDHSLYPLADGNTVRVQLVASDPGAWMAIDGRKLDDVGESVPIGTSPNLHNHAEWLLTLPEHVVGDFYISFKLLSRTSNYDDSGVYAITLTNLPIDEEPTATLPPEAEPTGTPTATSTPSEVSMPEPSLTPTRRLPPRPPPPPPPPTATATVPEPTETEIPVDPSPEPTPKPAADPTPDAADGDANCDGRMSAADLSAVLMHGLAPSSCHADANNDGAVDDADLQMVVSELFDLFKIRHTR